MLSTHRKAPVFIAAAAMFAFALALNFGCGRSGGSLDVYSVVESPSFSPSAGTYTSAQTVTISSRTPAAAIYYTTDDSEPKETSTKYTGPVSLAATAKIKAKAYLAPKVPSAVTSAIYTITGTVAAPTFSPEAGTYASAQNVSMSCLTSGASIKYTTDGTTPTAASTTYTGPIAVAATTTLKAGAFLDGYAGSAVTTGVYYIGQGSPPSLTSGGTFEGVTSKSVLITGSSGSTIYYTTDGSDPTVASSPYSDPIMIELDSTSPVKTQTVKAFALSTGKAASPITSETYTISLTTEAVTADDTATAVGKHTSIGLNSLNVPYISYFDETSSAVKYAYASGALWEKTLVDTALGAGGDTSLAISSEGTVHISYFNKTAGSLKHYNSPATYDDVDTGNLGAYTSLALEVAKGNSHISYYDYTNHKVKYASIESASSSYFPEVISDSALSNDNYGRSAIAVDDSGNIYILYHENGKIMSKTRAPLGNFTKEAIDNYSPAGYYLDLAVGRGTGSGVNVYAIFCTPSLQYSMSDNSGTSWTSPSSISSSVQLQHISLAVDSRGASDILHVSAYDASSQTLKYFTKSSGPWKEYCVDDSLKVGTYSSIAVDGSGYFHISYYDEANGNLKYATNKQ
jgi:hypothetical protein